jgi:hypothetical protein
MWTHLDSVLVWPNHKAYLFSGSEYVRYDIAADRVDPGYPAPIEANWRGLWHPAGAGVVWPNGKAYFFRGGKYVRYDIAADRVDDGYPHNVGGNWRGLSLSLVTAAVVWPTNHKAYLFGKWSSNSAGQKDGYVRYDVAADRQDVGYPTRISANWHGLPDSTPDAVVAWPNGKAYFFYGAEYIRYDIAADRADAGYPLPVAGNWPGVPMTKPVTIDTN